jgi:outer membrane protein OmpA-like peptidoglycan-associated protein
MDDHHREVSMRLLLVSIISGSLIAGVVGCESAGKKTAVGAGIGAAAGAVLGSVVGGQQGDKKKGALVGAALGAGIGGLIGNRLDKQAKELEKVAETKRTEQGIVTKLKSDILFDTGKADLKPAAKTNITKLAEILKKYPENVIVVKGYTDSQGSDDLNKALSEKRASAVKEYLFKGGVPDATLSTVGMGKENPVGDNGTSDGRSKNRRVEIEITVDESKVPQDQKS